MREQKRYGHVLRMNEGAIPKKPWIWKSKVNVYEEDWDEHGYRLAKMSQKEEKTWGRNVAVVLGREGEMERLGWKMTNKKSGNVKGRWWISYKNFQNCSMSSML